MGSTKINNSEFVAWASEEQGRITFGESTPYHAVLCDPPYGISFMGKEWDKPDAFRRASNPADVGRKNVFGRSSRTSPEYSAGLDFQLQAQSWGEALIPLLYPGALVFMFSGTRMWHRLATGMEDAGFHLWDTLMWLHGQGFPKAQSMEKAGEGWEGHKTPQLKPAWEPVLCFRAPNQGKKYVELALEYGSGCLNVDSGRIGVGEGGDRDGEESAAKRYTDNGSTNFAAMPGPRGGDAKGRYPANVALDELTAPMLDAQTGDRKAGASVSGDEPSPPTDNAYGEYERVPFSGYGDNGGASRFFYVAKAATSERNAGLDGKNNHPTVKPINLNKWLAGLLLPPASVGERCLLVPFSGSGSEMIGACLAGWDSVTGVEMDSDYVKIAEKRLEHWKEEKE